jgi:hypothetical protein
MTTLFIDGVLVVFEGVARLHWTVGSWRLSGCYQAHSDENFRQQPVLEYVWPRRHEQAYICRQIEHGQKTVVVVDGRRPVVTLPSPRAPHIPFGAVDVGGARTGERRLLIPRFTWLRDRDRSRGDAFLDRITARRLSTSRCGECAVVIERALVGSREPLRFVYCDGDMSLGRLQLTIDHMFRSDLPLVAARSASDDPGPQTDPAILAA